MYDHLEEIQRINSMDEQQILLKARNHKKFNCYTGEQYEQIRNAVIERLQTYGYEYVPSCCGRFEVAKINKK
jgi:hypothetical protein